MAPCLSGADLRRAHKEIVRLKRFLSGRSSGIIKDYEQLMHKASKDKKFELAAYYRDTLRRFECVRTNFKTADQYMENPNLLEDIATRALKELEAGIPLLNTVPIKIECYDISNISGKEAVGALVVSLEGRMQKSHYKRFKIRLEEKPDDVFMMKEVLTRRIKRGLAKEEKDSSWSLPDLIVLDGGKGQVSAGLEVLDSLGAEVPLIGLAKRKETIVYKADGEFKEINLLENNEGLKLLIRLRDEAHRFAQSYHHRLRLKKIKV
jgi:excinuclease ABC subunit C